VRSPLVFGVLEFGGFGGVGRFCCLGIGGHIGALQVGIYVLAVVPRSFVTAFADLLFGLAGRLAGRWFAFHADSLGWEFAGRRWLKKALKATLGGLVTHLSRAPRRGGLLARLPATWRLEFT
jgi:Zn-dependent protease with chaperone function